MRASVAAFLLLISSVMQQTNPAVPTAKPSAEKMDAQSAYDPTRDTLYRIYLLATIFGVVGAIGGVLVLIVQTKQIRISANAARDAAIAAKASSQAIVNSERPWLFIEIKTGPVAITAGQVPEHLSFTIGFRNCGKTPPKWSPSISIRTVVTAVMLCHHPPSIPSTNMSWFTREWCHRERHGATQEKAFSILSSSLS